MNIEVLLKQTLNSKEIIDLLPDKKAHYLHVRKPNKPYVEYEIINEKGDLYSENKEISTLYTVQVDIFSDDTKFTELAKTILKKMIQSGFNREQGADLYEEDTKLYHKAMRFNISLSTEN